MKTKIALMDLGCKIVESITVETPFENWKPAICKAARKLHKMMANIKESADMYISCVSCESLDQFHSIEYYLEDESFLRPMVGDKVRFCVENFPFEGILNEVGFRNCVVVGSKGEIWDVDYSELELAI